MHIRVSSLTNCKQMKFYCIHSKSVLPSQTIHIFFFLHISVSLTHYFYLLLTHRVLLLFWLYWKDFSLESALVFLNHFPFLHFWLPTHTLSSSREINFKSHFALLQGLLYSSPTFFCVTSLCMDSHQLFNPEDSVIALSELFNSKLIYHTYLISSD